MEIGTEVSYLKTKVGDLEISLDLGDDLVIIKTSKGTTEIYNRQEYETFLQRNQKINKLLQKN